jgi:hypothetical protein
MDVLKQLSRLDQELDGILRRRNTDEVREWIKKLLAEGAKKPGRDVKLHATYILERMAELAKDLEESGEDDFWKRAPDVVRWIDRGLTHVAYLVDPDSEGKFLASFEQTTVAAQILNPKDPVELRRRKEQSEALGEEWDRALKRQPGATEPRRKGVNIVLPDSY